MEGEDSLPGSSCRGGGAVSERLSSEELKRDSPQRLVDS